VRRFFVVVDTTVDPSRHLYDETNWPASRSPRSQNGTAPPPCGATISWKYRERSRAVGSRFVSMATPSVRAARASHSTRKIT
jgi:hypothetical protein